MEKSELEVWFAEQHGQIIGSARSIGKPDDRVLGNVTGTKTALKLPGADKLR